MFSNIKDEIFIRLGRMKSTNTGFHSRNCMMCVMQGTSADTRGRFGIRTDESSVSLNCFNCGFKASWTYPNQFSKKFKQFLKQIGFNQDEIQKINFELFKSRANEEAIPFKSTHFAQVWKEAALPDDSLPFSVWNEYACDDKYFLDALAYVNKRELPLDKIYWTPTQGNAHFDKRITIPFYYKNRIVGYTSRIIDGAPNKVTKYYNSEKPLDYVYNLDTQEDPSRKILIVCEGVIDALVIDGVSILGASLTNGQANLINQLGKRVILIPDQDKSGSRIIDAALQHGWEISFPPWDDTVKDAAKACVTYGKLLTLKTIIDFATKDEVAIKLKRTLKKWQN